MVVLKVVFDINAATFICFYVNVNHIDCPSNWVRKGSGPNNAGSERSWDQKLLCLKLLQRFGSERSWVQNVRHYSVPMLRRRRSFTISKIFSSETSLLIKIHMENLRGKWGGGSKV